jgi:hypothetical protein
VSACVIINVETLFMPRQFKIKTVDGKVRIVCVIFSLENNVHKPNICQRDEYNDIIE